ncbi:hypothetical protein SAMD00019534_007940 [Acytostelium subglobosum LB1]|uniref:hypothetical protein n=1 Tax=Acytostelium subglobosum LB1 TaxID=1410327 RepID=UPI00064486CF|nr:hypothetical protein SAMD00019534_007940 [Acytostelium subglobosum LB1]GAM17619.1 hypothetical protein SAMD00019534_007940 [Acytostelium subglobosum LB1]|eukprot:XP_012758215.1 hypothetical protein SAMD00019534_007940 [Acytostelium subglobosum LB1]
MNNYISLETQYFQLSFSMALYMDDIGQMLKSLKNPKNLNQGQGAAASAMTSATNKTTDLSIRDIETSSKVDDIFFVFRKVVSRSISSLCSPSICATINLTSSNFDSLYIPYIEILLKQTYGGDFDKKRDYFLVILNDMCTTNTYIAQMQRELVDLTNQRLTTDDEVKMITMCINGDSLTTLSDRMETLLKENVEKIVQILSIPINQLIFPINHIHYEINDQEYERYEINDPFAQDFLDSFDDLLSPYKSILLTSIFDKLINHLSSHVAATLEDHIKQKKFNFLGALQLSKDIRKIIDHCVQLTSEQNIRHKFIRLQQIVQLLTMDKVTDIQDYTQEGYQWKLSVLDIKLLLARRSDFPLQAVHNLKL